MRTWAATAAAAEKIQKRSLGCKKTSEANNFRRGVDTNTLAVGNLAHHCILGNAHTREALSFPGPG